MLKGREGGRKTGKANHKWRGKYWKKINQHTKMGL